MRKKKILLLGSAGMAGHVMLRTLTEKNEYEIVDVARNVRMSENTHMLDVTDKNAVTGLIEVFAPDFIINCIGVLIKGSNTDSENAVYINAYLPHLLAKAGAKQNARLIHISTDCVFSGEKGRYTETDFTDGRDLYAKSKALGEVTDNQHLTIRTSIVGPELKKDGEGLLHWFLNQSGQINGYVNAFWSGVTTVELAKAISFLLEKPVTGLCHLTNGTPISKHDLLGLFKLYFNRPVKICPYEGKNVNKSLLSTRTDISYEVPGYDQMVYEMRSFMDRFKTDYNYIF